MSKEVTAQVQRTEIRGTSKSLPIRAVQRPVPKSQIENPREFQLSQIRRRYKPREIQGPEQSTILDLSIKPSDPDFPFEMSVLLCSLIVPSRYPEMRPSIKVKNTDIPRGFAINIEQGFSRLAESTKGSTLLALMAALDKNLEVFLSEKKTETVKLVANADKRHVATSPAVVHTSKHAASASDMRPVSQVSAVSEAKPKPKPESVFTAEEKTRAQERRESETRQLEARLGRMPLFKRSSDGIAYTIPLEPRRRSDLPVTLQAVKTVKVFVPLQYPLQPCRVQLDGVSGPEVKSVEYAFEQKACESKDVSLMGHINNLAQNMHAMSKMTAEVEPNIRLESVIVAPAAASTAYTNVVVPPERSSEDDRSHIKHIPRPPEWDVVVDNNDQTDSSDYTYDSGDESSSESDIDPVSETLPDTVAQAHNPEKGTALSFPFIELYGIELLEVSTLNLSVKCERCKETTEITNLKNNISKTESCRKCATQLTVNFRRDLIHANAVRAGFLDLSGCTPVDLLPSNFIPTCSTCSTSYPVPGIVSVRGDTTSNVCRECHARFSFKIPEVKFLRISTTHVPAAMGPRRKKEVLGLVAGTELPRRGRCKHYSKSLRWFRFSCCQKVYPCDRCHDASEEHAIEHANRMICGYCSREQNYRPEDCGVCHGVLVGKKGGGFWEGGKGTRDRVRMSRKDKRKYRRAPGENSSGKK